MAPLALETLSDVKREMVRYHVDDLLDLNRDAVALYTRAIGRLRNEEWTRQLEAFRDEHTRNVDVLGGFVKRLGGSPDPHWHVTGPLKRVFVAVSGAAGDRGVLVALRALARYSRRKYARYARDPGLPAEVAEVVRAQEADERRHLDWFLGVVGHA